MLRGVCCARRSRYEIATRTDLEKRSGIRAHRAPGAAGGGIQVDPEPARQDRDTPSSEQKRFLSFAQDGSIAATRGRIAARGADAVRPRRRADSFFRFILRLL